MLVAPGAARWVVVLLLFRFGSLVWHSRRRLCVLFLSWFLVSGLPAIGDFGQKLADVLDFLLGPSMDLQSARHDCLRRRYFASSDIPAQRCARDA